MKHLQHTLHLIAAAFLLSLAVAIYVTVRMYVPSHNGLEWHRTLQLTGITLELALFLTIFNGATFLLCDHALRLGRSEWKAFRERHPRKSGS